MVDNVGRPKLEQIGLAWVFGLCCGVVDFGVFYDIWFPVLLYDQTYRFLRVPLPNHFCCNVNIFSSSKANKDRIGDLDQAIIDTVGVDMLDASFSSV